jgi:magnesium-dependent phosphatase-1
MQQISTVISLIVFDGDDTLWYGLDGGFISGVDYRDPGRTDFTFNKSGFDEILRSDGQRFHLFPEIRSTLDELTNKNVLISMASYNHRQPVMAALKAFEILDYFLQPCVEWSSKKDQMIKTIHGNLKRDGFLVAPETTLFVDDDHMGRYREQMAGIGVHFLQRGVDIQDLKQLLDHPVYKLVPYQKSLL